MILRSKLLIMMKEGQAEGEATAVLDARQVAVPDDIRDRITACTHLDQLVTWIRRAVTANTVHDLFDHDGSTRTR